MSAPSAPPKPQPPGGPHPGPGQPPSGPTHPVPTGPPPGRSDTAAALDSADLLLRTVELLAGRRLFAGVDLAHSAAARQRFIAGMRMVRLALAEAAGPLTPARRDVPTYVAPSGGPVLPTRPPAGAGRTPGSAAAAAATAAVCESPGWVSGAGVDVRPSDEEEPAPGPVAHGGASGRMAGAGSDGGEGGSFSLPRPVGPPRFAYCVGRSLAYGIPARCGDVVVHGLHPLGPGPSS
jgi:hypothetical protein